MRDGMGCWLWSWLGSQVCMLSSTRPGWFINEFPGPSLFASWRDLVMPYRAIGRTVWLVVTRLTRLRYSFSILYSLYRAGVSGWQIHLFCVSGQIFWDESQTLGLTLRFSSSTDKTSSRKTIHCSPGLRRDSSTRANFLWQFLFARVHERICPDFIWQMYLLKTWPDSFMWQRKIVNYEYLFLCMTRHINRGI